MPPNAPVRLIHMLALTVPYSVKPSIFKMASMRRAANQFARSVDSKQAECSTLHVRGAENIFSLYVFDQIVLAFYSQVPSDDDEASKLDFMTKDKELQSEIIDGEDGIRTLVRSLTL